MNKGIELIGKIGHINNPMEKEFEALDDLFDLVHSQESFEKGQECYDILKDALIELQTIKEAKPSEALKCLEEIDNIFYLNKYRTTENGNREEYEFYPCETKEYNTIENYILKTQEQEKENAELKRVLEVLFKKQVDLGWLWYCVHECINSLDEYNKKMPIEKFKLTQEEFDFLGRMVGAK